MAQPIVVKFPAFFPPPIGFRDDHYYGLRSGTDATAYWVDSRIGNDSFPGVDPEYPKKTIQAMVTALRATADIGAQIYCAGAFTESVIVTEAAPAGVSLIGHRFPTWTSDTPATNDCLTMRTPRWTIEGFEFNCPSGAAGILLENSAGDDPYNSYKTVIRGNKFDGLFGGLYGIEFTGSPHRVEILDNWFIEMHQGDDSAFCIIVTDTTGPGLPYQCRIERNRFSDSDNYIGRLLESFNVSLFKDNVFEEGVLVIPALYLDLTSLGGLGHNIVTGNYFGGTYTIAGGYLAWVGTPDSCWMGNMTEATPATVGDNGMTIRVPA